MGTERKKCGDFTDTDVYLMATSPFGHRAKDCCVIIDTGDFWRRSLVENVYLYELSAARLQPSTGSYKIQWLQTTTVYNYRLYAYATVNNYNDKQRTWCDKSAYILEVTIASEVLP